MRHHRLLVSIIAFGTIAVGTVVSASEHEWRARPINAAQEIPAPIGSPTGEARAEFELENGTIHFKLRMSRPMADVFMAHIHFGAIGTAGPVVVWLFGDPSPDPASATDFANGDVIASGKLNASDFIGLLAGKSIEQIAAALDTGDYYVNIHTLHNKSGEIRGQVSIHH
jgi:hypothetical protein